MELLNNILSNLLLHHSISQKLFFMGILLSFLLHHYKPYHKMLQIKHMPYLHQLDLVLHKTIYQILQIHEQENLLLALFHLRTLKLLTIQFLDDFFLNFIHIHSWVVDLHKHFYFQKFLLLYHYIHDLDHLGRHRERFY